MAFDLAMLITALPIAGLVVAAPAHLPRASYRKVGGLRFLRVGRFQASFCVVRGAR